MNDDSIKKLNERLKELAAAMDAKKQGLPVPAPSKPVPLENIIAEGNAILEKESPPKPEFPSTPTNPYVRARIEVLKGMKDWRRREVEEMEKTGNLDNKYYMDFVKEVAQLGDKYSY